MRNNSFQMRQYVLVLLAFLISVRGLSQTDAETYVIKTAESQLPIFLSRIEPGDMQYYGFSKDDELDNCKVGKPYRLLELNREFYDHDISDNVDYIAIKNEWLVPVTCGGQNRVLLTVNGNPGNYTVSGIGMPELARELQRKSKKSGENDIWYLLRITALSAEFFIHEGNNSFQEAEFVPLVSALRKVPGIKTSGKKVFSLEETERLVKNATMQSRSRDDGDVAPDAGPKKSQKRKTSKK